MIRPSRFLEGLIDFYNSPGFLHQEIQQETGAGAWCGRAHTGTGNANSRSDLPICSQMSTARKKSRDT